MKTFILFFYLSFINLLPVFASNTDSLAAKEQAKDSLKSSKKICSCELVLLANVDSKMETVALMAEKTSNGKTKLDFKITDFELWKEKKYLSVVFVNDLKVVEKIQEAGNCQQVFEKLKLRYNKLRLHSIIDMDTRTMAMR
ncbi:MAG: hypothetical protein EKK37_00125 [Sphingobacteriales bacterium]|nr:MAG: hypothetical protein EKK37_00125 [Sphingobacteriales bacterium]